MAGYSAKMHVKHFLTVDLRKLSLSFDMDKTRSKKKNLSIFEPFTCYSHKAKLPELETRPIRQNSSKDKEISLISTCSFQV